MIGKDWFPDRGSDLIQFIRRTDLGMLVVLSIILRICYIYFPRALDYKTSDAGKSTSYKCRKILLNCCLIGNRWKGEHFRGRGEVWSGIRVASVRRRRFPGTVVGWWHPRQMQRPWAWASWWTPSARLRCGRRNNQTWRSKNRPTKKIVLSKKTKIRGEIVTNHSYLIEVDCS